MNNNNQFSDNYKKAKGKALTSMVLGIISLISSFMGSFIVIILNVFESYGYYYEEVRLMYIVFLSIPVLFAVISLVFSSKARNEGYHEGYEKCATVLSIIALGVCLLSVVVSTIAFVING